MAMIETFSESVAETFVSQAMQDWFWAIPAVQTFHILALALAFTAGLLLELGILGVRSRGEQVSAVMQRFEGWIVYALCAAVASGVLLVIGEPGRSLTNATFWTKMTLFAVLVIVLVARRQLVLKDRAYDADPSRLRRILSTSAVLSIGLWLSIPSLGRWIAYTDSF